MVGVDMIEEKDWEWDGFKKHFIGGGQCEFGLATRIGDWVVSTVGGYQPYKYLRDNDPTINILEIKNKLEYISIGFNRKFETMVFKYKKPDCGCCTFACDVSQEHGDFFGSYNDAKEARKGHMEICKKVAAINE